MNDEKQTKNIGGSQDINESDAFGVKKKVEQKPAPKPDFVENLYQVRNIETPEQTSKTAFIKDTTPQAVSKTPEILSQTPAEVRQANVDIPSSAAPRDIGSVVGGVASTVSFGQEAYKTIQDDTKQREFNEQGQLEEQPKITSQAAYFFLQKQHLKGSEEELQAMLPLVTQHVLLSANHAAVTEVGGLDAVRQYLTPDVVARLEKQQVILHQVDEKMIHTSFVYTGKTNDLDYILNRAGKQLHELKPEVEERLLKQAKHQKSTVQQSLLSAIPHEDHFSGAKPVVTDVQTAAREGARSEILTGAGDNFKKSIIDKRPDIMEGVEGAILDAENMPKKTEKSVGRQIRSARKGANVGEKAAAGAAAGAAAEKGNSTVDALSTKWNWRSATKSAHTSGFAKFTRNTVKETGLGIMEKSSAVVHERVGLDENTGSAIAGKVAALPFGIAGDVRNVKTTVKATSGIGRATARFARSTAQAARTIGATIVKVVASILSALGPIFGLLLLLIIIVSVFLPFLFPVAMSHASSDDDLNNVVAYVDHQDMTLQEKLKNVDHTNDTITTDGLTGYKYLIYEPSTAPLDSELINDPMAFMSYCSARYDQVKYPRFMYPLDTPSGTSTVPQVPVDLQAEVNKILYRVTFKDQAGNTTGTFPDPLPAGMTDKVVTDIVIQDVPVKLSLLPTEELWKLFRADRLAIEKDQEALAYWTRENLLSVATVFDTKPLEDDIKAKNDDLKAIVDAWPGKVQAEKDTMQANWVSLNDTSVKAESLATSLCSTINSIASLASGGGIVYNFSSQVSQITALKNDIETNRVFVDTENKKYADQYNKLKTLSVTIDGTSLSYEVGIHEMEGICLNIDTYRKNIEEKEKKIRDDIIAIGGLASCASGLAAYIPPAPPYASCPTYFTDPSTGATYETGDPCYDAYEAAYAAWAADKAQREASMHALQTSLANDLSSLAALAPTIQPILDDCKKKTELHTSIIGKETITRNKQQLTPSDFPEVTASSSAADKAEMEFAIENSVGKYLANLLFSDPRYLGNDPSLSADDLKARGDARTMFSDIYMPNGMILRGELDPVVESDTVPYVDRPFGYWLDDKNTIAPDGTPPLDTYATYRTGADDVPPLGFTSKKWLSPWLSTRHYVADVRLIVGNGTINDNMTKADFDALAPVEVSAPIGGKLTVDTSTGTITITGKQVITENNEDVEFDASVILRGVTAYPLIIGKSGTEITNGTKLGTSKYLSLAYLVTDEFPVGITTTRIQNYRSPLLYTTFGN
jgi:hypothetical protein